PGEAPVGLRHREEDLGGQDELLAPEVLEHLAPDGFRRAAPVDVGCVEEVDAGFEGCAGAGLGVLALHSGAIGEPGAERDLRDLDLGAAELAELHGGGPYPRGAPGLSPGAWGRSCLRPAVEPDAQLGGWPRRAGLPPGPLPAWIRACTDYSSNALKVLGTATD